MTSQKVLDRVCVRRRLREISGYLGIVHGWAEFGSLPEPQRIAMLDRAGILLEELPAAPPAGRLARETDLLRGHVLRLKGNYNAAIGPLRRAAFGLHQNVGAWLALGWCYRRIGRYAQAVAAAKRACSVQPRNIIAIYNLACYLCLAGRRDAALDAVRAALRREPKLREFLMRDPDFDKLRSDEAFQALLEPVCRGG